MAVATEPAGNAVKSVKSWWARLRRSAEWQLLFHVIWQADRRLATAWWALIVLRALLPPTLAVATGWLVGAVQSGESLALPLATVGVLFALLQTLGPLHTELGTNLGDRTSAALQDRLITAAVRPVGIAHLEDPELANDFTLARDFDLGITAPQLRTCMSYIGSGFVSFAAGILSALVVCGFRWWAGLVLLLVWLSPHILLRESVIWNDWRSDEVKNHSGTRSTPTGWLWTRRPRRKSGCSGLGTGQRHVSPSGVVRCLLSRSRRCGCANAPSDSPCSFSLPATVLSPGHWRTLPRQVISACPAW